MTTQILPAGHRPDQTSLAWRLSWLLAFLVIPLSIALSLYLARHTTEAQRPGVLCLLAAVAVAAATVAAMAARPDPGQHHRRGRLQSPTVRAINRRAARRLIPAGIGLATLMAVAATKPVLLVVLAYPTLYACVMVVSGLSARWIVQRGVRARRTVAVGLTTLVGMLALSACTPDQPVSCPAAPHVLPSDPASPCRVGG